MTGPDGPRLRNHAGRAWQVSAKVGLHEIVVVVSSFLVYFLIRGSVVGRAGEAMVRGFNVIKLVDKRTKEAKPFADVQDEIRIRLRQREMERQTKIYLGDLRKKILVDIRM